jgi:uncharacterized protein
MSPTGIRFFSTRAAIVLTGLVIGIGAVWLQRCGNPPNMGVCVACFARDTAGAAGLHRFAPAQYVRPEIIGLIWGAFLSALLFGEFRTRGGSSPAARFFLGIFAMVGAMVFLGCPWRALLRLGGGDGTALIGVAGLAAGVWIGAGFLKRGYTLGRTHANPSLGGIVLPVALAGLLALSVWQVSFGESLPIFSSAKGPGSMHAPVLWSLGIGLLFGALAQRTRFCTIGGLRDAILFRDFHLISGAIALVLGALAANLILGQFKPGWTAMPIAHSASVWTFLAMTLAGLAYTLSGGCPGRHLFLSGEGNEDSVVFVLGLLVGAALAHNFALAAAPDQMVEGVLKVGGPALYGKIAVSVGLAYCIALGFVARTKRTEGGQS